MAHTIDGVDLVRTPLPIQEQRGSSRTCDWIITGTGIWWLVGLFLDGWAHSNIPRLETFFTPWHAVLYSGFLAVAGTLLVRIWLTLRQDAQRATGLTPAFGVLVRQSLGDRSWLQAIPRGYDLSGLGLGIFLVSGIGDMTWHLLLGIEKSAEALLSPTHLGLALGLGLAMSGPLRAAWRRPGRAATWGALGPAIMSLTFTFSLLTFFTSYASALIHLWPIERIPESAESGISDILLTTGLTMSFVLLAVRRWRLPFGTFTFMLGLNGLLMFVFRPSALVISLPTGLLGGLAADLVYQFLHPTMRQPESVRLYAFLVPLLFYILYFVDFLISGPLVWHTGIAWSAPFWAGAPVIAGLTGFLLSYVMIPPAGSPAETPQDREVTC